MTHTLRDRLERLAHESHPVGATTLVDRVERQLAGDPTTGLVSRQTTRRPVLSYAAAFVAVLVVGTITWFGLTRSDGVSAPADGGPADRWGLGMVDLPDTEAYVVAVLESMPSDLDGLPLSSDPAGGHLVEYGEGGPSLVVQSAEHRMRPDGTVATPTEWLAIMATAPELDVIGSVVDEPVVWLYATYAAGDGSTDAGHVLEFGDADGEFLFLFDAPTNEGLDAIVAAFIETIETAPDIVAQATTTTGPEQTTLPQDEETTTTTVALVEPPADPTDQAWIGIEFTTAVDMGWKDGEFGRLDEWVEDDVALIDVGSAAPRLMVDGQVLDLWPWHSGGDIALGGRPGIELVVLAAEPNPYTPGEYAQEIEGVVPPAPDPDARFELAVWAVDEIGATGTYVVTDVEPLVRSGQNMGYSAFVWIRREFDLCGVDSSVIGNIYGYFDHDEPEMEVFYPATLVFSVTDEGMIEEIDPSLVSCILAPDWEVRGY